MVDRRARKDAVVTNDLKWESGNGSEERSTVLYRRTERYGFVEMFRIKSDGSIVIKDALKVLDVMRSWVEEVKASRRDP